MSLARLLGWSAVAAIFCFMLSCSALAKDNPSYTQWGRAIHVGPNDQVGDVTCFGCSIYVRGQVAGDATVFGGSIVLEDQAQVAGDVTGFGGGIQLGSGVKVTGDVTVFGGSIGRDPTAIIGGDVTSLAGKGWFALMVVTPLIVIGLLVALIVWLIQRARQTEVPVAA